MLNRAAFTINGFPSSPRGFDASHSQTLSLALENNPDPDIFKVQFFIYDPANPSGPVASKNAPVLALSPVSGIPTTTAGVVQVTTPASSVCSYAIRCVVNNGVDIGGKVRTDYSFTRIVSIRAATSGLRKTIPAESTEYGQHGWSDDQNDMVDAIESGGGGGGGGGPPISVADNNAARALSPLADGQVVFVRNPSRTWTYFASDGAGFADDDLTILKPTAVDIANNGRLYPSDPSAVVPTFAAARLAVSGKHRTIQIQARSTLGDGGGGPFDYDSSDTTSSDNDGTTLVAGTRRLKRRFSGNRVHGHWWGMKPDDGSHTFNNYNQLASLLAFAAGKYIADIDGVDYAIWDPTVPSVPFAPYVSSPIHLAASYTKLHGVRGKTKFNIRCSVTGGDPTDPTQIYKIPSTTTPMLRSTHYAYAAQAVIGGKSYVNLAFPSGGDTSANPADAPSGYFEGTHTDGTCLWSVADQPYRCGAAVTVGTGVTDCEIDGIKFDLLAPWIDNTTPPPGLPTYTLVSSFFDPSMYAFTKGHQCIYAYGHDIYHLGVYNAGPGSNDRNAFRHCEFLNSRGEQYNGDGQDPASFHTTMELDHCFFNESPCAISSSAGLWVHDCHIKHHHRVADVARGSCDFRAHDNFIEDCAHGWAGEQGLQSQANPGTTWIHDNIHRNVYFLTLWWNLSPSGTHEAIRALDYSFNKHFDCGWGSSTIQVQSGAGILAANGCTVHDNEYHVGAIQAPARTGSQTGTRIFGAIFSGDFHDLEYAHERYIIDDAATAAGHTFQQALNWSVGPNSTNVRVHDNEWISIDGIALPPSKEFLVGTGAVFTDAYFGLWERNHNTITGTGLPYGGTVKTGQYAPGDTVLPKGTYWEIYGSNTNAVTALPSLDLPSRWMLGQRIKLTCPNNAHPVVFPQSSATHLFRAPRLLAPGVELVVERVSTSLLSDVPMWQEVSYISTTTRVEPTADAAAPTFQSVNSEAPAIEMWGVHRTSLTPSSTTHFDNVLRPPIGEVFTVGFNTNTVFDNNSGAGAIKLQLAGGANYAPTQAGEIDFIVQPGTSVAKEVARREGTTSTVVVLGTAAPANVTKAAASAGTSGFAAHADHKHDVDTAAPVDIGTANAEGTATSLARSNHQHSLPFATVQTVLAGASGDISVNAHKVTNVQDPTSPQDAATKAYVDAVATGLSPRQAALALATTNVTPLSGLANTIDGIAINTDGMRVVLTGQSLASENGPWVAHSGAWTRPADFATGSHVAAAFVFIQEGTANQDSGWVVTTDPPNDVVGTNSLALTQFSGAGQINAGAGMTKTGNRLDVVNNDGSVIVNADELHVAPAIQSGAAAGATAVQPTRQVNAGAGLTGGGALSSNQTIAVLPTNGTIIADGGGTRVGVIADANHGNLSGGSLHAVAVAGGAAGFMSGADKTKLDAIAVGAIIAKSMATGTNLSDTSFTTQDIGDLEFAVSAGETWIAHWRLQFFCSDVATGIAVGASWPAVTMNDMQLELFQTFGAGVVTEREILGSNLGSSGSLAVFTTAQDLVATAGYLDLKLLIHTTSSGNVTPQFRMGANTGGGHFAEVLLGSYLIAHRVA